jgi:hypothetical protein
MKQSIQSTLVIAAVMALLSLGVRAETSSAGFVDFGKFSPASSGREFIEVQIKKNLISMVARLAQKQEPEVAELVRGIEQVRVNVIGLDDQNRAEVEQRVEKIHGELETKGWERIVTVQEQKENVRVYVKTRGEEAVEGIVVTILDSKQEAILINVVGNVKPEQLATVGERFDVEPLKKIGKPVKKS